MISTFLALARADLIAIPPEDAGFWKPDGELISLNDIGTIDKPAHATGETSVYGINDYWDGATAAMFGKIEVDDLINTYYTSLNSKGVQ